MTIPRNEYPRPQLVREPWINLNGTWQFEIDNAMVGIEKEFYKKDKLNGKITVPFCPESKLSGIGNTDFMNCVWYKKTFDIPKEYKDKRIILHFGAVDYFTVVYINCKKVGEHKGGYTSFSFDITEFVKESGNDITVCAFDDVRSHNQPAGKQSDKICSYACSYTRTTGIWQTVWLEFVSEYYVKSMRITSDIKQPTVNIEFEMSEHFKNTEITAEAFWDGKSVGKQNIFPTSKTAALSVPLSENLDITKTGQIEHFLPEWIEAVKRDFNHPSIIGWCPLNETWDFEGRKQSDSFVKLVYEVTKAIDPTRPVIDTSGNFHVLTDIFDVHDYEQNPEKFAAHYEKLTDGILEDTTYRNPYMRNRQKYDGISPTFVSEYGGIRWSDDETEGWGYGEAPKTGEEFLKRYQGLTQSLINNPHMLGFCYTQLYDVEQELNGLMTYNRKFKFDPELIRKINSQKAAIEELDE